MGAKPRECHTWILTMDRPEGYVLRRRDEAEMNHSDSVPAMCVQSGLHDCLPALCSTLRLREYDNIPPIFDTPPISKTIDSVGRRSVDAYTDRWR